MKTVFKVDINPLDFLRDYKKYSKDSFICPGGFDKIEDFAKGCRKFPDHDMLITFSFDEPMWFNLGDTVLLNNIYYKVTSKTFHTNHNIISYNLNYE